MLVAVVSVILVGGVLCILVIYFYHNRSSIASVKQERRSPGKNEDDNFPKAVYKDRSVDRHIRQVNSGQNLAAESGAAPPAQPHQQIAKNSPQKQSVSPKQVAIKKTPGKLSSDSPASRKSQPDTPASKKFQPPTLPTNTVTLIEELKSGTNVVSNRLPNKEDNVKYTPLSRGETSSSYVQENDSRHELGPITSSSGHVEAKESIPPTSIGKLKPELLEKFSVKVNPTESSLKKTPLALKASKVIPSKQEETTKPVEITVEKIPNPPTSNEAKSSSVVVTFEDSDDYCDTFIIGKIREDMK